MKHVGKGVGGLGALSLVGSTKSAPGGWAFFSAVTQWGFGPNDADGHSVAEQILPRDTARVTARDRVPRNCAQKDHRASLLSLISP